MVVGVEEREGGVVDGEVEESSVMAPRVGEASDGVPTERRAGTCRDALDEEGGEMRDGVGVV